MPPKHQYSNKENLPIRRNEEKIKLATFENKENLSSSANYSQMSNEIKYPKNNDGALKHSYNPNGVRPVQHNMKKKPRKERKTSSLNYDVKFEKKVDYSHIKSKIKEEVDYHRELNKKPRKINDFLKEEIKINDNNERDSQPIGSIKYEDNWKKKYSTIPNTDSKYQAKNVGKVIKTGVNFYSKGNSNETETNGEENYDNEYQNFESTNSNPQEKLNRNYSDPYQKYQVRHYQAGDSFRPQSQDLNLSDKHFHYGDKEEIPENYENSPTDDNENEIQQNNNKPYQENSNYLKHMTEYSGYSANSNKEKITDIANNFLNSPLMGQLSQESEPKYQRDSGFMRNQGKQLKNTDGQDFASLKRNLEPKAPHYYYSLQNEQMNKASKNFNGVDSPVNYDRKNNNNNNLNIIHSSSNNNQMKNSNLFLNKKTSLERDPDTHSSSMSSNFSVFNPNEELKSFFQKEFLHNNGSQSLQEEGSYNEDEIEDNNFVKSGNSNGSGQSNSEMKNNDYLEKYDRYGSGQSNFEMKNNSSLEKFDRKSSGQSNYEIENEENLPKFNKMENQQFNKKEKQYAYDYSYLFKRKK